MYFNKSTVIAVGDITVYLNGKLLSFKAFKEDKNSHLAKGSNGLFLGLEKNLEIWTAYDLYLLRMWEKTKLGFSRCLGNLCHSNNIKNVFSLLPTVIFSVAKIISAL